MNEINKNNGKEKLKEKIITCKEELIIFSLFFVYLIVLRLLIPIFNETDEFFNCSADWFYYIKMANDITSIFKGEIISPFCYRPLMPFLAGLLPFDLQTNFAIISFISIYLTGVMLYLTLKIHFNKTMSFIGLVMFCYLSYLGIKCPYWDCFFHMDFYNVYLVDPLAFFFMTSCFYCILTSRKKLYCLSLFLGVLTKEIVLFTIPVFLIYIIYEENKSENRKDMFQKLFNNLIYLIPTLIFFILFRLIVKEIDLYHSLVELVGFTGLRITQFNEGYDLFYYSFGIWGILIIFFFFNKKETIINWLKLYGIFMILIYLQIFIALSVARLIYSAFYPMIFLSVSGLNRISELAIKKIRSFLKVKK